MAKFVPLTLMSKTQKTTLYLNMDQVRYLGLRPRGERLFISAMNTASWSKKMRPGSPRWCGADNFCLGIWVMIGRDSRQSLSLRAITPPLHSQRVRSVGTLHPPTKLLHPLSGIQHRSLSAQQGWAWKHDHIH
jgi:hypothetical protein